MKLNAFMLDIVQVVVTERNLWTGTSVLLSVAAVISHHKGCVLPALKGSSEALITFNCLCSVSLTERVV